MPNRSRRNTRRTSRRSSSQHLSYPFLWSGVLTTAAQQKQISAGDLNLDLTRPLRVRSCNLQCAVSSPANISCIITCTLVADGQEGTVSPPLLVGPVTRKMTVRQARMMDFGLYGSAGSLVVLTTTGTTISDAANILITGKVFIEYKNSPTLRVISGTLNEHQFGIRSLIYPTHSLITLNPPSTSSSSGYPYLQVLPPPTTSNTISSELDADSEIDDYQDSLSDFVITP